MDRKSTGLDQMQKLALRSASDSRGLVAELAETMAGTLEELDAAKQDKITGQAGQVAGFDKDGNLAAQSLVTMQHFNAAIEAAITGAIKEAY